jgi:hypothetical protein
LTGFFGRLFCHRTRSRSPRAASFDKHRPAAQIDAVPTASRRGRSQSLRSSRHQNRCAS